MNHFHPFDYNRVGGSCFLALVAIYVLMCLTGCKTTQGGALGGLSLSYTTAVGSQEVTGFFSGGSYGVIGKMLSSGKQPVKVSPQK